MELAWKTNGMGVSRPAHIIYRPIICVYIVSHITISDESTNRRTVKLNATPTLFNRWETWKEKETYSILEKIPWKWRKDNKNDCFRCPYFHLFSLWLATFTLLYTLSSLARWEICFYASISPRVRIFVWGITMSLLRALNFVSQNDTNKQNSPIFMWKDDVCQLARIDGDSRI